MLTLAVSEKDHLQGNLNAPVTLVEYGDYECPHCGHAHPIVKRLQKHLGSSVAFVFRNFPLNEIHPNAEAAAESAEFAAANHKFWPMHDAIYENQNELGPEMLLQLTTKLGLPEASFTDALENGTYRDRVRSDFMGGVRSGVNGTPTFFINGQRLDGPWDYENLLLALKSEIDTSKAR